MRFLTKLIECVASFKRRLFQFIWETRIRFILRHAKEKASPKKAGCPAVCIAFSKDRALQLHALLSSYCERVIHPVPVRVLYHSSNGAHQEAYEEVIRIFSGTDISFREQKSEDSFRSDLIEMLNSALAEKVFFLVDDIVFIEKVDLQDFTKFETEKFIPSLRLGMNLKWCYTLQREQPLPEWLQLALSGEEDKLFWKWKDGSYDWGYPLSLDGHLFGRCEILELARLMSFRGPNSFEEKLQLARRLFSSRVGVCYRKSRIMNIPCNKVQEENDNLFGGTHQDLLLEEWNRGSQMDFRKLYGFINESAHQDVEIELVTRDMPWKLREGRKSC